MKKAKLFANLLVDCAKKTDINILLTSSTEAEAIKLFALSVIEAANAVSPEAERVLSDVFTSPLSV